MNDMILFIIVAALIAFVVYRVYQNLSQSNDAIERPRTYPGQKQRQRTQLEPRYDDPDIDSSGTFGRSDGYHQKDPARSNMPKSNTQTERLKKGSAQQKIPKTNPRQKSPVDYDEREKEKVPYVDPKRETRESEQVDDDDIRSSGSFGSSKS